MDFYTPDIFDDLDMKWWGDEAMILDPPRSYTNTNCLDVCFIPEINPIINDLQENLTTSDDAIHSIDAWSVVVKRKKIFIETKKFIGKIEKIEKLRGYGFIRCDQSKLYLFQEEINKLKVGDAVGFKIEKGCKPQQFPKAIKIVRL
jgi:hypothetical protein